MKNAVLISILIPLYNAEKWIEQTIQSAINQTYTNIEVIIVDDGSTDNSLKIAKKYESQKVKVYTQKNAGGSAARNKAFELSKGDYIQYLDADDILHPQKIKNQINFLKTQPKAIASGRFGIFFTSINNSIFPVDEGFTNYETPIDWLIKANWNKAMFPPIVWLTPRIIIDQAGKWNEKLTYNDDTEFFCRVLLKAKSIVYCEDSISYYRRGITSSIGSQKTEKALKSWLKSHKLVTSHLLSIEDSQRVKESCAKIYRHIIYSLYPDNKEIVQQAFSELQKLNIEMFDDFSSGKSKVVSKVFGWKLLKHFKKVYRNL